MALNFGTAEPRARDTTPILLTTGATPLSIATTFATGVIGPPVVIPTIDMVNPLRNPIEVTELHLVTTESVFAAALDFNWQGLYTGAVEMTLALGQHQITSDWCPVRPLGVRRDSRIMEGDLTGQTTSPLYAEQIRWIFPEPLIIGPNEGFSGMFRLNPNLPIALGPAHDTTVTISMVARGRRLPAGQPVPRRRSIPYASGVIMYGGGIVPQDVLRNTFQTVLHVKSINMMGVALGFDLGTLLSLGLTTPLISGNSPGGLANVVNRSFLVSQTAFAIFAERFALEEPHDLNPDDMHQLTVPDWVELAMLGCRTE